MSKVPGAGSREGPCCLLLPAVLRGTVHARGGVSLLTKLANKAVTQPLDHNIISHDLDLHHLHRTQASWVDHKRLHRPGPDGWHYATRRGAGRSLTMPDFNWTGPLRPWRIGPMRSVRCGLDSHVLGLMLPIPTLHFERAPQTDPANATQIPDSIPKPEWYLTGRADVEVSSRQQHTRERRCCGWSHGIGVGAGRQGWCVEVLHLRFECQGMPCT